MKSLRISPTAVVSALLTLTALAPGISSAAKNGDRQVGTAPLASSPVALLPCATYDTTVGGYGAWVFELRKRPHACTQYKGNEPCHCTESPLTRIQWQHWGSRRATARATWHYCGMGTCIYRPARLIAFRSRDLCGEPVYTRLRMKIPKSDRYPALRELFKLPACGGVFDYT